MFFHSSGGFKELLGMFQLSLNYLPKCFMTNKLGDTNNSIDIQ